MSFNLTLIYCIMFPWHEPHHCYSWALHILEIKVPAANPLCAAPKHSRMMQRLNTVAPLDPTPPQNFPQHLTSSVPLLPKEKRSIDWQRFCTVVQARSSPFPPPVSRGKKSPTGAEVKKGSASFITSHNTLLARHRPGHFWSLFCN